MNLSRCLALAAAGLLSVLIACGPFAAGAAAQSRSASPPKSDASPPKPEGEMRWAIYVTLAPQWFDPAEVQGQITPFWILYAMHDALVKPMPGNLMTPSLAESWTVSADQRAYEFKLREGLKFHNGDAFTAEDVKFSFQRTKGTRILKEKVREVTVVDPYRVRFQLHEPFPDFMAFFGTLTTGAGWIVPKKYVERVGDEGFKKQPIGLGPYKFVSHTVGVELVMEAYEAYWRKVPAVKRLVFKVVPEPTTRAAMLKRGEVDVAYMLDAPQALELQRDPALRLAFSGGIGIAALDFLDMWDPKSPWADRRVRLAANYALDRRAMSEMETLGASKPTGSIVPRAFEFALPIEPSPYDPAKARQLLAEAGYPNGFDAVFKVAPQYYYTVRSAEVVASQLAKVGIRATIQQIEWGQWLSQVFCLAPCQTPDYDMSIIGHAEAWDIGNFANPKYYFRWDSPEFQKLYAESQVASDDKTRRALYVKMQEMLADEAPAVWLYMHPRLVITKKGVTGFWKDLPAPVQDLSEVAWQK
jgi:peptide/nickel transport system substrate-binding protein